MRSIIFKLVAITLLLGSVWGQSGGIMVQASTIDQEYYSQDWLEVLSFDGDTTLDEETLFQLSTPEELSDTSIYHPLIGAMYDKFYEVIHRRRDYSETFPQGLEYENIFSHTFLYEILNEPLSKAEMSALNYLRNQIVSYSLLQEYERSYNPFSQTHDPLRTAAYEEWHDGLIEMYRLKNEQPDQFAIYVELGKQTGLFFPIFSTSITNNTIILNRKSINFRGNQDYSIDYDYQTRTFSSGIINRNNPFEFSFEQLYGYSLEGEWTSPTEHTSNNYPRDSFSEAIIQTFLNENVSYDLAKQVTDSIFAEIDQYPYYYPSIFYKATERLVKNQINQYNANISTASMLTVAVKVQEYANNILSDKVNFESVNDGQDYGVYELGANALFNAKGVIGDFEFSKIQFSSTDHLVDINDQKYEFELEQIAPIVISVFKPDTQTVDKVKVSTRLTLNNAALSPHYPYDSNQFYLFHNDEGTISIAAPNLTGAMKNYNFQEAVWIELVQ